MGDVEVPSSKGQQAPQLIVGCKAAEKAGMAHWLRHATACTDCQAKVQEFMEERQKKREAGKPQEIVVQAQTASDPPHRGFWKKLGNWVWHGQWQ